jgi:hypothetical protein
LKQLKHLVEFSLKIQKILEYFPFHCFVLLREIKSLKKVTLNFKKIDIDPKLDFEGKL